MQTERTAWKRTRNRTVIRGMSAAPGERAGLGDGACGLVEFALNGAMLGPRMVRVSFATLTIVTASAKGTFLLSDSVAHPSCVCHGQIRFAMFQRQHWPHLTACPSRNRHRARRDFLVFPTNAYYPARQVPTLYVVNPGGREERDVQSVVNKLPQTFQSHPFPDRHLPLGVMWLPGVSQSLGNH